MSHRLRMQVRQLALLLLLLLAASPRCLAETPAQGEAPQQQPAAVPTTVPIGYLKQEVKKVIPLSRLKVEPEDIGIAGAEIALTDNNTTGRFTKQQFTLEVERVPVGGDAVEALEKLVQSGHHYIVVDAPAETSVASVGRGQRQGRSLVQRSRQRRESS